MGRQEEKIKSKSKAIQEAQDNLDKAKSKAVSIGINHIPYMTYDCNNFYDRVQICLQSQILIFLPRLQVYLVPVKKIIAAIRDS